MAGGVLQEQLELLPGASLMARRHRLKGAALIVLLALAGPLLISPSGRVPPLLGWAMFLMFIPVLPVWLRVGAGGLAVRVAATDEAFHIGKSSVFTVVTVIGACLGFAIGGIALLAAVRGDPGYAATASGSKSEAVGVMSIAIFGTAALLLTVTSLRRGGLIVDASGIRRRPHDPLIAWTSITGVELTEVERLNAFLLHIRHDGAAKAVQVYVPAPTTRAGEAMLDVLRRYRGIAPRAG